MNTIQVSASKRLPGVPANQPFDVSQTANWVSTRSGRVRAICESCDQRSAPVDPRADGQPSVLGLGRGWSCAEYVATFRHADGSAGSLFTCSGCRRLAEERRGRGDKPLLSPTPERAAARQRYVDIGSDVAPPPDSSGHYLWEHVGGADCQRFVVGITRQAGGAEVMISGMQHSDGSSANTVSVDRAEGLDAAMALHIPAAHVEADDELERMQ